MQKIKNWKTQTKIYFIIVGMVVLLEYNRMEFGDFL